MNIRDSLDQFQFFSQGWSCGRTKIIRIDSEKLGKKERKKRLAFYPVTSYSKFPRICIMYSQLNINHRGCLAVWITPSVLPSICLSAKNQIYKKTSVAGLLLFILLFGQLDCLLQLSFYKIGRLHILLFTLDKIYKNWGKTDHKLNQVLDRCKNVWSI